MTAITTSTLAGVLLRSYTRKDWFAPFERLKTPFLDSIEKFDNEAPLGVGRFFEIWLQDSHNTGSVAESGNLPSLDVPTVVQGQVTGIQVAADFGLSELMLSAGQGAGTFGRDVVKRLVLVTTRNLMTNINRLTLGHGTARLGVVNAGTTAATTFVCKPPELSFMAREGMRISFYNTDTGGSIQDLDSGGGNVGTVKITYINPATHTVTIDFAATLTADWSFYQSLSATAAATTASTTTYGVATNGLNGIVDNATYQGTIFTLLRSTYPDLNCQVIDSTPNLQPYSEALVRKAINLAYFASGADTEALWCNRGIISEHLNSVVGDRRYNVPVDSGSVPSYKIGYDPKKLAFQYKGKDIPFNVDEDLPARTLYGVTTSLFKKHVLRDASWVGDNSGMDGSASPILMQTPATDTYALSKIAGQLWIGNIAHSSLKSNFVVRNVADAELANDSVPVP